jgi:AAA15 family ATPase/GTPase
MIKKVKINQKYRTIPENFELDLENTTVITGINNSGKTNFIKILAGEAKNGRIPIEALFYDENDSEISPEIVYIAAENVQPSESEAKSSSKSSGLVANLSKLISNMGYKLKLENHDSLISDIKELVEEASANLKDFNGRDEYSRQVECNEEELAADIIIQAIIKNIFGCENEIPRKLDELGQGTQRIIVASILKAYKDILIKKDKLDGKSIIILFEEPEIYLHPSLKKTLNMTLKVIAGLPNHQVIITTHDPYFAYTNLNDDSVLYSFGKDKDGNTVPPGKPNVIFGIEDELLHIHLFNKVLEKATKEEKDFKPGSLNGKDCCVNEYFKSKSDKIQEYKDRSGTIQYALPLFIRHIISHPSGNVYTSEELSESIKILSTILSK